MKKTLILIMSLLSFGLLVGCQTTSETNASQETVAEFTQAISGTVSYRERIALPENAIITVTLEDISLADAPSTIIATQEFTADGKQVPFAFELAYDNDKIQANHRYNIRASIHVDGKLRFTTDTIKSVITDVENTQQADLRLVSVR
ncbi:YbaY family lipoprotein [Vibrio artabrorum]|uniref:YbaY family lipoprotein n=1 Tax=Vibrio artabrorum TaxID=446374 RepID=A0ABT8CHA0_9VIBR|nr:YbaY family lipoprotein [Vibrio artabrorum]MDN3699944.1 YbaY family lipoprotein [Vibrio artabrorum]